VTTNGAVRGSSDESGSRRSRRWLGTIRTGEHTFYRCNPAASVPLATLVCVAGRRWTIDESIQAGMGLTGLDEHQVRGWTSWHRRTILAILTAAFLAVTAPPREPRPTHHRASSH
jgi:SRSO17 transposase